MVAAMSTESRDRRVRRLTGVLAAAASVGVLAACGGPGAAGPRAGTTPSGVPSHEAGTAGSPDHGFPLDAYLGAGGGPTVISSATEQREYQERIARCMAAQGFDYVPEPAASITARNIAGGGRVITFDAAPTFPDLPPDQFAARFGYGISTAPPGGAKSARVDPNDRIVAAMSVAERVAYEHALYGPATPLDSRGYLRSTVDASAQACIQRADRHQPTEDQVSATEHRVERVRAVYRSLLARVDDLRSQETADPRMDAATRAWSGCMAAAGFPGFTGVDQPRARMLARARAVMGQDLDARSADPARLARLRRSEIAVAVADDRCRQPWDRTLAVVRRALEEAFVRANLEELRSFRSAMAAAQAGG
jgi:hypothetical protein